MDLPKLSAQRRELLAQATEKYADSLVGSAAEEYLAGRGIPADVAGGFRLGFVSDPIEGHERFRGRLAIPYLTPTGAVGMRFRSLDPEGDPKYDSEAGQRTALFNVRDLHRSEPWVCITEGELDCLVVSGIVGVPAVGVPGVEHWKKNGSVWSRLFQDYETVYVLADGDKPGRAMAKDVARLVENPVVIDLPDGRDVNELVVAEGPDFLLNLMGLD